MSQHEKKFEEERRALTEAFAKIHRLVTVQYADPYLGSKLFISDIRKLVNEYESHVNGAINAAADMATESYSIDQAYEDQYWAERMEEADRGE
jgi:hypothetical protein